MLGTQKKKLLNYLIDMNEKTFSSYLNKNISVDFDDS